MKSLSLYKISKRQTIMVLMVIGIFHLWLFWPGSLTSDSQSQYEMAIAGVYTDHHPPLMSFVWRHLDKIVPGSGMMLLLHLSLLYSSIFYLIQSLSNASYRFLFVLLPFIPQVFVYSFMIWKDVGFAFSFLFVSSYLSYLTSIKRKPFWYETLFLFIILFYGTAIKFQAQYCAPVLLGWMAYIFSDYTIRCKKFISCFFMLLISFYILLNSVNTVFIKNVQKNYSWQYVKLYDLAAISVETNNNVFPEFAKNKNFTIEKLSSQFNHERVDDLVFSEDAVLKIGGTEKERRELWSSWFKAVYQNPLVYLKHRTFNMSYIVFGRPGFTHIQKAIENTFPKNSLSYILLYPIVGVIAYLTMSSLIPLVLGGAYFIYAICYLRRSWASIPLLCFSSIGILVILSLFFFSMAGTPRYIYINFCLFHASHVFAYLCFKSRKQGVLAFREPLSNLSTGSH